LEQTVQLLKERVNPELTIVGGIMTNCQSRRSINEQVRDEVKRLYTDLGQVRSDAKLLYATTEGSILQLKSSNAMDDYADVLNRLIEVCPWLRNN
jgi:cellulose biosynthesis protein BcsQ